MATYVIPAVKVFQDFQVLAAANPNPLRAHIAGGHAKLLRYADTDERDLAKLGYYDRLLEQAYDWPQRPAGGIVDFTYTKLWVKDALLKYFNDTIGAGSTITKTSGYNNRVRSATINFAANGDDYPRHSSLLDRDVQVGDVAKVRGINGDSDPVTLWTYVKDIIGDDVAATVAAATTDASNPATQSASSSVTKISGVDNCVSVTADHSAYDGLPDGSITDTYDIIITEGSVNSDYTLAKARVISGSGLDDQAEISISAKGVPTDIGTRGLTVTFDELDTVDCSQDAEDASVSADDLIAGQRWRVTVNDNFTKPVPTSGGTYDGDNDTTYIVEVSRGGLYTSDDLPQINVSTTNGIDISGPTDVEAASTAVDVGTHGVTIAFTGTGLRKGDRYYITVTSVKEGPMRTIVLGHNLDTDIPASSEVDLTLFIRKPLLQIEKNRTGAAPLVNWEQSDTEFTVKEGITAFDDTWTDSGVPQSLELYSESSKDYGGLYVEVRYWLSDLCNEVNGVSDVGNINDAISGALHPDNPLKWGVYRALLGSNGTEVKFTSVCDPDKDENWADVLELLVGRDDVYGLVPLTRRDSVLDLYEAHVNSMSSPENGLWRVAWFNLAGQSEIPVVHAGSDVVGHLTATTIDGEVALGIIEDDNQTSGTQYTILRCPGNNAQFLTLGVRAGDIVRTLYTGDGFGNYTYQEFVVDEVQSEDQLRLLTGPAAPINVAAKFEVWRNLTPTEEAAEVAQIAGARGNRRIRAVWPDQIEDAGVVMDGYHLCATLAGLRSGILPHQGMTHLEVPGYSNVDRTVVKFNKTQLDSLAVAGTWIVTQDVVDGTVFNRHAVTTAAYDDINKREEMITSNVDSISYRFKDQFAPFIGVTNVTPQTLEDIRVEAFNLIEVLKTESFRQNLGGQLIAAAITELRQHLTLKDHVVLTLNLTVPYALNNLEINLVV